MLKLFNKSCEYALQAVLYLAHQADGKPVFQREISEKLNIPSFFLGKILQQLYHNRIVLSQKGRGGGFLLGKKPEEITLYDIVEVMEGPYFFDQCVLGFPGCSDENHCPVHFEWQKVKDEILTMLKENNIKSLSQKLGNKLEYLDSKR